MCLLRRGVVLEKKVIRPTLKSKLSTGDHFQFLGPKKTKDGQELAWGRNADFQCFPNKSVRVLEAKSFHCRLHHVTKKYDFCKSERKWLCLDYKCAHFAAHLTLMTGNMAIMHDDVPRKHLLKDFPDFLVFLHLLLDVLDFPVFFPT